MVKRKMTQVEFENIRAECIAVNARGKDVSDSEESGDDWGIEDFIEESYCDCFL